VAFLVDADAYFRAFAETVARARQQVLVLGWDLQAAARLQPRSTRANPAQNLRGFLNALVARRRDLHIHLLGWDFSLLFALEREFLPSLRLGWRTQPRIHFRLDGQHPLGACHHQKIVVVDDSVAFVGGLDLTVARWDTPEHAIENPDRVDGTGTPYPPFHDVQIAVEGRVAAVLGDLVRQRWRYATGQRLLAPRPGGHVWPPAVQVDLAHVPVAVARTGPAYAGRPEVREVEALYLDAIAAARRWIYIENQYLTSGRVCEALAARLREADGPEVVLVVPRTCSGWLEERTMGTLRRRFLERLAVADHHHRLHAFYPRLSARDDVRLNVHAKVMVVDDSLVRIGSSNLSNRSMGLDTECDLAIEAAERPDVERAIARFRNGLLAEHLDVTPEEFARQLAASSSLASAVAHLQTGARTLRPLDPADGATPLVGPSLLASSPVDLERPIEQSPILEGVLPQELREPAVRTAMRVAAVLVGLLIASALWTWTGLQGWASADTLAGWAAPLRDAPAAPLIVIAGFVVASALMIPTSALILACALVFDPPRGALYALGGSVAAAGLTYAVGRTLWGSALRQFTGRHLERVAKRLVRHGVVSVALVRLLPIAPFTVVNLVAGGMGLRTSTFLLGTVLGLAPDVVLLSVLADALRR